MKKAIKIVLPIILVAAIAVGIFVIRNKIVVNRIESSRYTWQQVLTACGFEEYIDTLFLKKPDYTNPYYSEEVENDGERLFSIVKYGPWDDPDIYDIMVYDPNSEFCWCHFSIYRTEEKAQEIFHFYDKSCFEAKDYEEGENYMFGWWTGIKDGSKRTFRYVTRNMLVELDEGEEAETAMHEMIMKKW